MLIYYFPTVVLAAPGREQRCNLAPSLALYCIRYSISLVSMSYSEELQNSLDVSEDIIIFSPDEVGTNFL